MSDSGPHQVWTETEHSLLYRKRTTGTPRPPASGSPQLWWHNRGMQLTIIGVVVGLAAFGFAVLSHYGLI